MLEVLLVDDEPLLLESLEIILSMNQIKVIGMAHDGKEALAILREKQCQMALVDLNMKGMGGIELIKEIKKGFPWIKILVLTTFYDDKKYYKCNRWRSGWVFIKRRWQGCYTCCGRRKLWEGRM